MIGDFELHFGSGQQHPADGGVFESTLRGKPGNQCARDHHHRRGDRDDSRRELMDGKEGEARAGRASLDMVERRGAAGELRARLRQPVVTLTAPAPKVAQRDHRIHQFEQTQAPQYLRCVE